MTDQFGAEQGLLGIALSNAAAYWRIADVIKAEDFTEELHRQLFELMAAMFSRNESVTPLTVEVGMRGNALFAQTDGKTYLDVLVFNAPARSRIEDLARIIRSEAQWRRLSEIGDELVLLARDRREAPVKVSDEAGEALYAATHGNEPGEGLISFYDLALRAAAQAEEAHNNPQGVWLTSGLKTVDGALGGLYRGDLLTVGAATSMGKTSLIQLMAEANASAGHAVAMFSLEMSGTALAMRSLAQVSKVSSDKLRSGRTSTQEIFSIVQAPEFFAKIGPLLRIDSTPELSVSQMRARCKSFKRNHPLSLVIVDHLQFVKPEDTRADEKESAKQITRDLTRLAKDLNVAVVLVSHLTKDHEKRSSQRPMMSDLYGSSAIAQNSDSVWFLYRPHYYLSRNEPDKEDTKAHDAWERALHKEIGWAEVFSTKARMGQTSSCRVRFAQKLTRFYDDEASAPSQDTLDLAQGLAHG